MGPFNRMSALHRGGTQERSLLFWDPFAYHALGHAYALSGDREKMIAAFEHAMDPADSFGNACAAIYLGMAGRPEETIAVIEEAIRLSPQDPFMHEYLAGLARAHFAAERYGEAVTWGKRALESNPAYPTSDETYRLLAASYVHLGRLEDGRDAAREAARLNPEYSLAYIRRAAAFADPDYLDRYLDGLRKAGLPE